MSYELAEALDSGLYKQMTNNGFRLCFDISVLSAENLYELKNRVQTAIDNLPEQKIAKKQNTYLKKKEKNYYY